MNMTLPVTFTLGAMLFYGGITGAALTLCAAVVTIIALKKSKKNIIAKLNVEYSGDRR